MSPVVQRAAVVAEVVAVAAELQQLRQYRQAALQLLAQRRQLEAAQLLREARDNSGL